MKKLLRSKLVFLLAILMVLCLAGAIYDPVISYIDEFLGENGLIGMN